MKKNIIIGVMGGSQCDSETYQIAKTVGRLIAERGAILLCGGRGGVMEAAAQGAKEAGGLTIGIMPGMNGTESPANEFIDIPIFTGLGYGRNWVNVCSSDSIIAISGKYGTLSEIALAMSIGKAVVLLNSWQVDDSIARANNAEDAVEKAFSFVK